MFQWEGNVLATMENCDDVTSFKRTRISVFLTSFSFGICSKLEYEEHSIYSGGGATYRYQFYSEMCPYSKIPEFS